MKFTEDATFINNEVHPNPSVLEDPEMIKGGAIFNTRSGEIVFTSGLYMEGNKAEV